MLSNAYFLAKFRFDTAENEPAKNLQFSKNAFFENALLGAVADDRREGGEPRAERRRGALPGPARA